MTTVTQRNVTFTIAGSDWTIPYVRYVNGLLAPGEMLRIRNIVAGKILEMKTRTEAEQEFLDDWEYDKA